MSRIALPVILLVLAVPAAYALQIRTHGVPASVTSPTPDGQLHGIPSSVTSPTPAPSRTFGNPHSRVIFGNPHQRHRRAQVIPVPVFYPVYVDNTSEPAPPPEGNDAEAAAEAENDALREAYNRGAQDAVAELRARQRLSAAPPEPVSTPKEEKEKKPVSQDAEATVPAQAESPEPPAPPAEPTIFIFKDGRRLETQNYAIVGQTLYDFSVRGLHKIKLAEFDLDATRRINDEMGTPITLP